jgi:hypothetical protein
VHVAGVALVPHAADADLCLLEVGVGQADAVEHRLRRTLAAGLSDARRIFVQQDDNSQIPIPNPQKLRFIGSWELEVGNCGG